MISYPIPKYSLRVSSNVALIYGIILFLIFLQTQSIATPSFKTPENQDFAPAGRNVCRLFTPTCRFALRRAVCRLPLRGVGVVPLLLQNNPLLIQLCKSKHNFEHFDRRAIFFGLKAQKQSARGRASASPRVNRVKSFSPCKGKSVPVCHLFGERLLSFLYLVTLINFQQANYLTFGGCLSRNAGDFLGLVSVGVDFFNSQNVQQVFEFQVFAK